MLVDFELIRRAQKGDEAAFNEVVLAYRRRILGTIARLIGHPEDVEDVGQEVFLRLMRYETAELIEHPQAYLYKVASNVATEWSMRARNR